MGRLSRNKGAAFERLIAKWMNMLGLWCADWRRELRETQQGNIGDVRDYMRAWPLRIQCKHMKKPSPFKALREAKEAASRGDEPEWFGVAMIRRHGGEDMVCMDPRLFGALIKVFDQYLQYLTLADDLTPGDTLWEAEPKPW